MDRPHRKSVSLTARERLKFQELVRELDPSAGSAAVAARLDWSMRLRMSFWRHRRMAALLVPLGLAVMIVSVVTWWPLGLVGAVVLAPGVAASNDLLAGRIRRTRARWSGSADQRSDG